LSLDIREFPSIYNIFPSSTTSGHFHPIKFILAPGHMIVKGLLYCLNLVRFLSSLHYSVLSSIDPQLSILFQTQRKYDTSRSANLSISTHFHHLRRGGRQSHGLTRQDHREDCYSFSLSCRFVRIVAAHITPSVQYSPVSTDDDFNLFLYVKIGMV
jgi:hypothetical protein